jgi:hypothetical protein
MVDTPSAEISSAKSKQTRLLPQLMVVMVVMMMMVMAMMHHAMRLGEGGTAQRKKANCCEQSDAGQFGQRRHGILQKVILRSSIVTCTAVMLINATRERHE